MMKKKQVNYSLFLGILFSVIVIILLVFGLNDIEKEMNIAEEQRLEESLYKAAVSCYSIEGYYPASLDYLIETYGIQIDESKYNVHYETMGSNIMPIIEVIRKSQK